MSIQESCPFYDYPHNKCYLSRIIPNEDTRNQKCRSDINWKTCEEYLSANQRVTMSQLFKTTQENLLDNILTKIRNARHDIFISGIDMNTYGGAVIVNQV